MNELEQQTLALASVFQSALLISQIAEGEAINQAACDASVDSIFTLEAPTTEAIYGQGEGLIPGLKTMVGYLGGDEKFHRQKLPYYVLSMLKLEKKLRQQLNMAEEIHQGLLQIQQQVGDFALSESARLHKIDLLYQDTLSQIKPRIIVQGDQTILTQSDHTSRIRSLLFAGLRAAVLWQQKGGSRWKLVFSRKRYLQQARSFLEQLL